MKDIKHYEGEYAITSCGKVWSYKSKKFLKPTISNGYKSVLLCKNGKTKAIRIHRLVAEAYIPNPENKPEVNHIDENREHNWVNNLNWMTRKENINWGTGIKRRSEKLKGVLRGNFLSVEQRKKIGESNKKPIFCIENKKIYDSLKTASKELNIEIGNISKCLKGKRKTAGGYHFKYCM